VKDLAKSWWFLVVLVGATALGPLAIQIFLPSLPAIQADLQVSGSLAQLVFSLSAGAIAVSMLVYGPVSDRFGRRPTLAPLTLTRTIIRDLYGRERSASMIAYITMAMVIAPMLAPAIGGYLNDWIGWRANFAFCGLVGVLVTALVITGLPETHHQRVGIPGLAGMFATFGQLLRNPAFCGFALQSAFCLASFFSFAAAAPYVVIVVMERSASAYGLFFIVISLAFMLGNFVAGRISERVGVERMVVIGSSLAVLATLSCLLAITLFGWVPWALFGPCILLAIGNGFSVPNAMAGAISVEPRAAGAASGLAGFLQMLTAAVFAQLSGMWQNGTPFPMVGFMIAASALALLSFLVAFRGTGIWSRSAAE
jgi:DHA1 family bicyclomycin/chloramphenicol resistance-like MFS transporter